MHLQNCSKLVILAVAGCSSTSITANNMNSDAGVGSGAQGHSGGASTLGGSGAQSGSTAMGGAGTTGGAVNGGGGGGAAGGAGTSTTAKGGATVAGGANNTGGTIVAGGATGSGGSAGTGGSIAVGGVAASVNTGGSKPAGGTASVGGATSTGSGPIATGGAPPTGGTAATGGARPTGGAPPIGGAPPTGGMAATGGSSCASTLCAGACVDLSSDKANCGTCGHSCRFNTSYAMSSCLAGKCQPVVLASGQTSPSQMAQDATYLYWLNIGTSSTSGTVARAAKDGSMDPAVPALLSGAGVSPRGIGIFGTVPVLYWGQNPDISVGATTAEFWYLPISLVQSSRPVGLTFDGTINEMATNATTMFWTATTSAGGIIMSATAGGINVTTLCGTGTSCTTSIPVGIAIDSTSVYWTDVVGAPGSGRVYKIPLAGGAATPLATLLVSPQHIAVYGTNAYFQSGTSLMHVGITGIPGASAIASTGGGGIAADASGVYWTDSNSTVYAWPTSATAPVPIATGQGTPAYVAVDATTVYWTNLSTGTVMAVAK